MRLRVDEKIAIDELLTWSTSRLDNLFSYYLSDIPSMELKSAIQHSLLNGGKRLRPSLIYATGFIFDAPMENMDIPAAAVEMVHTYSLIHDDLPCMDDADLRRGNPSCHKIFGEGMAILAGDALHTLAMQIIAAHPAPLQPNTRVQMMHTLSQACGPFGMAAGQALDISLMHEETLPSPLLEDIYRLKTGALFSACIHLGWLSSEDDDEMNQQALKRFGDNIGLAFQIQDDILDVAGETEELGKPKEMDLKNNKITYPKIHGLLKAQQKVEQLYHDALQAIEYLGSQAQLLRDLTRLMLDRKK